MHWILWYHYLNHTSVFPGVASPLKVLILDTHPKPSLEHVEEAADIHIGRGDLWTAAHACLVPILSPWKVTSPSSTLAILLSPATLRLPWGDPFLGTAPSLLAASNWTPSGTSHSCSSSRSWSLCLVPSGAHCLSGAHWGEAGSHLPILGRPLCIGGATALCSDVVLYLCTHQGPDTELDRLAMSDLGCSKAMQCGHQIGVRWEC